MTDLATDVPYYGGILDILHRYLPVSAADAQLLAFEDTWQWGRKGRWRTGSQPA